MALALAVTLAAAQEQTPDAGGEAAANSTDEEPVSNVPAGVNCGDGLIVPIWKPYDNLSMGDRLGRGLLYILLMVYLFIGVSIVSDRFMESIETITASEKEVTVKDPKTGKNTMILMLPPVSMPEVSLGLLQLWFEV